MPFPKIKSTAVTTKGHHFRAWAMHKSDFPLCSAHAGLTGAREGSTNAITHDCCQPT
jgi:hypothetical protein